MATTIHSGVKLALAALVVLTAAGCEFDVEYVVNTTEDLPDLNPGDGVCATNKAGDQCSLRAAFEETNATVDTLAVRITVPAGAYQLTLGRPLELTRGDTHVLGEGTLLTFIDGIERTRIVEISGSRADVVVFDHLTLMNGRVPDWDLKSEDSGCGGAVLIESDDYLVTFIESAFVDNVAAGCGGGIYADGTGVLQVINTLMAGNATLPGNESCDQVGGVDSGGAIFALDGTLNLIQSEVRDNCGTAGGGVMVSGGANHLFLRSTIAGNESPDWVAGIWIIDTNVRIEDSTIAGNRVTVPFESWPQVGALFVEGPDKVGSHVEIISSTIADNEIQNVDASYSASGIRVDNDSTVTMQNTVIASPNTAPVCDGGIASLGGNFLDSSDPECAFDSVASDIVGGGDPGLNALAGNGGITRTMLPTSWSPLVDAGIPGCEDIDQRGLDYEAPKGEACDIGSVER